MKIQDLFGDDYALLDDNPDIRLDAFMETSDDNQSSKYAEPLVHIYLHKYGKEMFLILNCINHEFEQIDEVCKIWESKVMAFINFHKFSKENENIMKYLKYNISLIILCQDENEPPNKDDDDHFRYKTEKSLVICRKIFILCNEAGELAENNDIKVPFYFEPIYKIESEGTIKLEEELNYLLPDKNLVSDNRVAIMSREESLSDDEIDEVSRWLDNVN